jgi:hypothetical protein
MTLQEVNAALSIAKNLKDVFPFVGQLLKQADESAFNVWRHTPVRRLERLQFKIKTLTDEYPGIQVKLTDNEKYSPISGTNKTFNEYAFAVDENKLEYLQNALLNGSYGDYTLELREQFYRMIQALHPLDIRVLEYLVGQCPSISILEQKLEIDYSQSLGAQPGEKHGYDLAMRKIFNQDTDTLLKKISLPEICNQFPSSSKVELRVSLDRLRQQLLMSNPISQMDMQDPYFACTPTDIAQPFLRFIADPRNSLKKHHG